jgi:16S rRNA (guanine966-N2)-methyltransferase
MSLRVIGGSYRNRVLKAPKGELSRPTTAIMRKAVFDICQQVIDGAHFLDLFACSGAMGIEALSRGAATSTFIEKDRQSFLCLKENIKAFHLESQAILVCGDVFSQIKRLESLKKQYDIVYMDPPYPLAHSPEKPLLSLLRFFDESSLLTTDGILFMEEGFPSFTEVPNLSFSRLLFKNTRKFGKSLLHQFIMR